MLAREDLVTFADLPGWRVIRRLGYVSGKAERPQNRLRSTFRSIGLLVGLAPAEFVSDAERLRGEALELLRVSADRSGANAVLALQFHVSESPDGACVVVAFGEAVRVARNAEPKA
ncbi:MAG TPA: heavy metal-binding domain-containing protein [Candidatus Dormibacteraeota bacterium]|nr:heavy metal-binding domain-containing protein [Candidatus Dormibacteraeota bacterium]